MLHSQEYWLNLFRSVDAVWTHDGNPNRPHALLTSGNHSDGFVNTGMASCRPEILDEILDEDGGYCSFLPNPNEVDWVVGSALGAVTWSYALARKLHARSGFTEKVEDRMELKRFPVRSTDRVLVCEDVISTGGSTLKTLAALKEIGCAIHPQIAVIVNRSGKSELNGFSIRSVVDLEIGMWTPDECPLCRQGSEAVRPKANWDRLTADL